MNSIHRRIGMGLIGLSVVGGAFLWRSAYATPPTPPFGVLPLCQDKDGDGYGLGCPLGPDCNDNDPEVHPGHGEVCNFRDDDCNGLVDDGADCPVLPLDTIPVEIPAGVFEMGSNDGARDETPVHHVSLASFRIDRYEVTTRRYKACVASGRCDKPALSSSHLRKEYFGNPDFDDYPVIYVNWHQAAAFCAYDHGRLPTEAEWESAARGPLPSPRTFPWGDAPADCSRANMGGPLTCVGDTDRVGRRQAGASPFGAMDMAGNVWEWVADWYDPDYYAAAPQKNPAGPDQGSLKVMRGGCFESGADSLRVSCRKPELPSTWAYNVGFRCAYPEGGER